LARRKEKEVPGEDQGVVLKRNGNVRKQEGRVRNSRSGKCLGERVVVGAEGKELQDRRGREY